MNLLEMRLEVSIEVPDLRQTGMYFANPNSNFMQSRIPKNAKLNYRIMQNENPKIAK
jgi:hypothetical protein